MPGRPPIGHRFALTAVATAVTMTVAAAGCTRETQVSSAIATSMPGTSGPATTVAEPTTPASPPTNPTTTTTTTTTTPTTTTTTAPTTTTTTTTTTTSTTLPPSGNGSIHEVRPPSDLPAPALPVGWTTAPIGTSVLGREITALHRSVPAPAATVMVVGGIHGNEPVSPPTVRAFVDASYRDDVAVWLIPELNPDGVAAGTRWNARGVDLNRNFTWDWRPDDGGPAPLSEPESDAITGLIDAVGPDVVIWVHQPYGYVSSVGPTDRALESAWSAGSGLPTRSGVTQHGGGESWTVFEAELPAMLIEIDTWSATQAMVQSQLAGFQALLDDRGWAG